ncbi:MAG: SMP-30/gluconolactonase/LRE family protein [Acidobacteriota bacterium]
MTEKAPPLPKEIGPYPVVANIDFAEGPIFDAKGNLYFVNYVRNGTLGRMTADGTVSIWCETGGQVNGLKVDSEGYVVGADPGAKRVIRVHPDGKPIEVLTDRYEGKPYLSPNDVCLDLAGNIYFSDPSNETPEAPIGSVYRIDRNRKVTRLATGMKYPNGLAVSPDQKQLLVAETMTNRILVFDFKPDGSLSAARTLYQFPTASVDGIMFDEYDRLWVARWTNGTVDVITLDGKLVAEIPAGGTKVTNLCFFGQSLYVSVAGSHSIHRLDVGVRGKPYTK